jgi:hypothetical protein
MSLRLMGRMKRRRCHYCRMLMMFVLGIWLREKHLWWGEHWICMSIWISWKIRGRKDSIRDVMFRIRYVV